MQQPGVGTSGPTSGSLTVDALVAALRESLHPEVTARAQHLASRIQLDGAQRAARRIEQEFA